jgi:hypothetical protein
MVDQHAVRMRLRPGDPVHGPQRGHGTGGLGCPDQQHPRLPDDVRDRAGGQPPALVHDHHMGAGLLHLPEQVAGQDDRPAIGRVPEQDIPHLPDLRRIQAVHRLVQHQQVGHAEHGLGDGEPLAHPARVGPHLAVDGGTEAGHREYLRQVRRAGRTAGGAPVQV